MTVAVNEVERQRCVSAGMVRFSRSDAQNPVYVCGVMPDIEYMVEAIW